MSRYFVPEAPGEKIYKPSSLINKSKLQNESKDDEKRFYDDDTHTFNYDKKRFNNDGKRFNNDGKRFNNDGKRFNNDGKRFNNEGKRFNNDGKRFNNDGKRFNNDGKRFNNDGKRFNYGQKKFDFGKKRFDDEINFDEDPYEEESPVEIEKIQKYQRGERIDVRGIKGVQNQIRIMKADHKIIECVRQTARNELLLPETVGFLEPDDNEDTYRIRQNDLASAVDITSAAKFFSLSLPEFGPYKINYSRDGRHLLLGGHRGHVAAMDWVTKRLLCEINVMESVHDLCWLHIPTMFATAQKDWVYIYDNKGIELHCIKKLSRILNMEFLPYHFLLVTSSEKGFLSWLDVSIGKLVKETYTNAGRLNVLCQNPYNAVVATGHPNGTISMWSPNVEKPLVRMLCHTHPIRSVAIDARGLYMATTSIDRSLKVWDVRTHKCLQSYKLGAAAGFVNFSQKDLLAVGLGNVVEVYKDCCKQTATAPYLRHKITSTVSDIQFCDYEDILGIGHSRGFQSMLVPGAGEPNFDAYESNPFMNKKQRREMEVKSLLEKIQPELITLNPSNLGTINVPSLKEKIEERNKLLHVKPIEVEFEPRPKRRSKSAQVFHRKKGVKDEIRRRVIQKEIKSKKIITTTNDSNHGDLLERFKIKSK